MDTLKCNDIIKILNFYFISLMLCIVLLGQTNDAESKPLHTVENPGALNDYLQQCRPCRTCIAIEESIEESYCPEYQVSPACSHAHSSEFPTYFGVNYKQFLVKPLQDWQRLFVKTNPAFNFYFGGRLYTFFGFEAGYEWTANKPLITAVNPGDTLLGLTNTSGVPVAVTAKQRFRSGYVDLNLFIPVLLSSCIQPEGILSVGIGTVKPSVKLQITPLVEPYKTALLPTNGKGKGVLRLGVGVQSLFINNIGMRLMWQWQNTSSIKFKQSMVAEAPSTRHIFKNAHTLSAGFYFYY